METEKYFIRDTSDDAGIYLEIPMAPPTTNKLWLAASQRNYARRLSKEAKAYNELVAAIVAGRRVPDDWETVVVKIKNVFYVFQSVCRDATKDKGVSSFHEVYDSVQFAAAA